MSEHTLAEVAAVVALSKAEQAASWRKVSERLETERNAGFAANAELRAEVQAQEDWIAGHKAASATVPGCTGCCPVGRLPQARTPDPPAVRQRDSYCQPLPQITRVHRPVGER